MATTKASQRAVNKYKRNNYDRMEVFVSKGRKDIIKAHANNRSESVNGFIGRAVSETMERDNGGGTVSSEQPGNDPLLSAEALEMVRQAAECTGETISEFLMRAAKTQAQRDKRSLMMGINPAEEKPKG